MSDLSSTGIHVRNAVAQDLGQPLPAPASLPRVICMPAEAGSAHDIVLVVSSRAASLSTAEIVERLRAQAIKINRHDEEHGEAPGGLPVYEAMLKAAAEVGLYPMQTIETDFRWDGHSEDIAGLGPSEPCFNRASERASRG